ncbi:unnamed protein product [Ilex paraguariensis]|uniref:Uncharacterized protein n=1 Tax=Ilex paraguariensis TaxID=185542 RepID=A0ABC8QUN2_9AQUA
MSSLLPIRTHHLSPSFQFKKRSLLSPPPTLLFYPCLSPSFLRFGNGERSLHRDGVLARAEDKARGSSASPARQQHQPNSEKQLQDLTPLSGACDPLCSVDETSTQEFEANYQPKTDLLKALAILAAAATGAVAINHSWVAANQDIAMALLFGIGYAGIIFEESLAFNKSGVGLLMAVSLWVIRSIGSVDCEFLMDGSSAICKTENGSKGCLPIAQAKGKWKAIVSCVVSLCKVYLGCADLFPPSSCCPTTLLKILLEVGGAYRVGVDKPRFPLAQIQIRPSPLHGLSPNH